MKKQKGRRWRRRADWGSSLSLFSLPLTRPLSLRALAVECSAGDRAVRVRWLLSLIRAAHGRSSALRRELEAWRCLPTLAVSGRPQGAALTAGGGEQKVGGSAGWLQVVWQYWRSCLVSNAKLQEGPAPWGRVRLRTGRLQRRPWLERRTGGKKPASLFCCSSHRLTLDFTLEV